MGPATLQHLQLQVNSVTYLAHPVGLEPTTLRLTAGCSTIELQVNLFLNGWQGWTSTNTFRASAGRSYLSYSPWQFYDYCQTSLQKYLPYFYVLSGWRESNPQSQDPKSCALPIRPHPEEIFYDTFRFVLVLILDIYCANIDDELDTMERYFRERYCYDFHRSDELLLF